MRVFSNDTGSAPPESLASVGGSAAFEAVSSPDSTWSLEFITLDEFIRLLPPAAVRRNGRAGETGSRPIACDDVESNAYGLVCQVGG
jgi:hypothetical protein